MIVMIYPIIVLLLIIVIVDYMVTKSVYKDIIKDTPAVRNAIKIVMENKENEYRDGIFHILNDKQRESIQYISKMSFGIVGAYSIPPVGWIPKWSPLKKLIDGYYKQAEKEYKEEQKRKISSIEAINETTNSR